MEENPIKKYDTIIIGAGPAGAFSAISLAKRGLNVLLLEKGGTFSDNLCKHFVKQSFDSSLKEPYCCHQQCLSGFGGAALHFEANFDNYPYNNNIDKQRIKDFTFSSSLQSVLGEKTELYISKFYDFMFDAALEKTDTFSIDSVSHYVKISSSGTIPVNLANIRKIVTCLEKNIILYKVQYLTKRNVTTIQRTGNYFLVSCLRDGGISGDENSESELFLGSTVIVATGYRSMPFVFNLIKEHKLSHTFPDDVELGFRLETPSVYAEKILGTQYNPRVKSLCGKHRTFCICSGGRIMKYPFSWESKNFVLDGQHAYTQKGNKTNFSLLSKVKVPANKNSYEYVHDFVESANKLTPGFIPVQKLLDYINKKASSQKEIEKLSLTICGCSATNLLSLVQKYSIQLDWFLSFANDMLPKPKEFYDSTLLLAPSVVKYAPRISLNGTESSIKGLYFIGDACGLVSGISAAGAMGLMAADQIIESKLKKGDFHNE